MRIPKSLVDDMIAHAVEDLPNECCGLVGGVDGEARRVYRARNELASPFSYQVHTSDQFRITEKEMPERGEELVAIYHSHTKSAAYPSQTDLNAAAGWPEPMYIIVSLADRDRPEVRGYWLKDMEIADAELTIT
jgi:[CysO sulfur-carrier protein]-S-L-cysteine hydrolase